MPGVNAPLAVHYLNVGGKHLQSSQLPQDVTTCDLLCFAETHHPAGAPDWLKLQGFATYQCCRPAGQHGGLCVLANQASPWFQGSMHVQSDPGTGILWVHLRRHKLSIAVCYFAPPSSRLYAAGLLHPHPHLALMEGISAAHNQGHWCLVVGDMNIRLGRLSLDIPCLSYVPTPAAPVAVQYAMAVDHHAYQGIPVARTSADLQPPAPWARPFLQGLQAVGAVVLNGRAPGDEQGSYTFYEPPQRGTGRSVVDLACITASCYQYVQQFQVLAQDPVLSPDHCMLRLSMSAPMCMRPCTSRRMPKVHRPVGSDHVMAFRRRLAAADSRFACIKDDLQAGSLPHERTVQQVEAVLVEACVLSRPQGSKGGHNDAGWYDAECAAAKQGFWVARHAWREGTMQQDSDPEVLSDLHGAMLEARHAWDRLKRQKKRQHAQQHQHEIVEMYHSACQQHVWRLLKGSKQQACPLSDVDEWTQHFSALYGGTPPELMLTPDQQQEKELLRQQHQRDGGAAADQLNAPFTVEEVTTAMCKLRNNKGYDVGGLTCELLRYAVRGVGQPVATVPQGTITVPDVPTDGVVCPSLVECLTLLFEQLPRSNSYPEPMAVSRLVPLHKKQGDASVYDSYRGISISGVVGQLHDSVLNARAEQYVDAQQLRAPVQCGFRRKYGTLDALFTMQHLISRYRFHQRTLYVCYVDFQKAFDMVRRDEVIARAMQLGMHGRFLAALAQWLSNSKLSVHVNGRHGKPFPTHRGTKQGGRLSPLLFGLFIEQLHELITMKLPGAGALLEDMRVPDIMFADDVKLVATSPEELQALLDVLHLFCLLFDMPVHIRPQKTCIVVYGTARARASVQHVWKLGDQVVPVCESYTDLGLQCTESAGMRHAHVALAQGGRRAMHALLTLCKQHHLVQPDLKLRLFNTMVDPALSYGCQVWGPWLFHKQWRNPSNVPAEAVLKDFLRIMAGVGKRVKYELLLHDFMRLPTVWRWVCLAVRLCTKLKDPAACDKLSAMALRDDVRLMLHGCQDCWVFKLLDTLSDLGVVQRQAWQPQQEQWPTVSSVLGIIPTEKQVKEQLQSKWDDVLLDAQPDVDDADAVTHTVPTQSIMLASYLAWVRPWDLQHKLPHLKCQWLTHKQLQCIARMRLGWHSLAVQQGRFRRAPRCKRSCELCCVHGFVDTRLASWSIAAQEGGEGQPAGDDGQAAMQSIDPPEDLLHFLVECRVLEPVRNQERFRPLFQPDVICRPDASTLARYIMNFHNQALLADALQALHDRRALCLERLGQGEVMTDLGLPVCPSLRRLVAWENFEEAPIQLQLAHQWY